MPKFVGPNLDINTGPGGDEGGEIHLAAPTTGTTLSGNVNIDVYQNRLRIFESGGSNRGAYIDISAASTGVGSNLLAGGGGGASTLDGLNDVTAPSPSTGDFLKWNGTAWVNDAIDLATDTTGSYVSSLVAGTGITITNNSGEAATPTIAVTDPIPTGTLQMFAGVTAPSGWLMCNTSTPVSRTTYAALFAVIGTTYGAGDGSTTFNLPDMRSRMPIGAGTGTGLSARNLGTTGGVESVTLTAAQSGLVGHGHGNTFSASSGIQSANHSHGITIDGNNFNTAAVGGSHAHNIPRGLIAAAGTNRAVVSTANNQATIYTGGPDVDHVHNANHAHSGSSGVQSADHSHTISLSGSVSNVSSSNASESHDNMSPFLTVNFIIKT